MKTTTPLPTTLEETMHDILHQLSDNKSQRLWIRSKFHEEAISLLTRRKLIDNGRHGYHKVITDKGNSFFKSSLPYDEWLEGRSKPSVHIGHNFQGSNVNKSDLSTNKTEVMRETHFNLGAWLIKYSWQLYQV